MPWLCGEPDGEAQFYLTKFPDLAFATPDDAKAATGYVLVDFSIKHILPDIIDPLKVIQVIDHRLFTQPAIDFPNAVVQIDAVGAAATQIAEYFKRDGIVPSYPIAAMLYGAIYTHTLCLNSTTTTERDRDMVAWLTCFVPDADDLVQQQLCARATEITDQMPDILKTEMKIETSRFGEYGFTLVEIKDAVLFWQTYKEQIAAWAKQQERPVVVDIIDPQRNECVLFSLHPDYNRALEQALSAKADLDSVLILQPAWFRKQIIPLLK